MQIRPKFGVSNFSVLKQRRAVLEKLCSRRSGGRRAYSQLCGGVLLHGAIWGHTTPRIISSSEMVGEVGKGEEWRGEEVE